MLLYSATVPFVKRRVLLLMEDVCPPGQPLLMVHPVPLFPKPEIKLVVELDVGSPAVTVLAMLTRFSTVGLGYCWSKPAQVLAPLP